MLILNICLSDIPAESRSKGKDGKIYANFVVTELREKDKFDNTHTVYMSQTKEQREANPAKVYVGRGKEVVFTGNAPAQQSEQPKEKDGLPF
jgi:hypothetical protein